MNFKLTEEQRAIQDMARNLAQSDSPPSAAQLNELGLFGITTPEEFGGFGMGLTELLLCLEQLSASHAGTARTLVVHNLHCIGSLLECGSESQKERWLPLLSSGECVGTFANANAEGASRNVVQGANAGLLVVEQGGQYSLLEGPVADAQALKSLGFHGAALVDFQVNSTLEPLQGVPKQALASARLGMAAIAVGIANAALRHGVLYAQERTQFGAPISNLQAIQWKIADSAMALDAARLMTWSAAYSADNGHPFESKAAKAANVALQAAVSVTDHAVQIHGGYGYTEEFPVCGLYQDARACWLADGGLSNDRDDIGAALLAGV